MTFPLVFQIVKYYHCSLNSLSPWHTRCLATDSCHQLTGFQQSRLTQNTTSLSLTSQESTTQTKRTFKSYMTCSTRIQSVIQRLKCQQNNSYIFKQACTVSTSVEERGMMITTHEHALTMQESVAFSAWPFKHKFGEVLYGWSAKYKIIEHHS